ncbi:hypothetical protein KP79_PYT01512 [Mizuhopecten yessoensis]|uniref:Chitin-binding type-4 domain-containing protein n=1 Tax=Mizuhopecten yessoensis TaxID=6573 RepID=A0A210QAR8_MIZYE|nr:hypothetical protein KP79_PYT01512 [Mizuhopecten yessoensis]
MVTTDTSFSSSFASFFFQSTDADYERKCGPCGDAADSNRPNEYGGKYSIGEVVAQYHEGHQINISVDIRSINQGGTFRFSLCVTDKTTRVSHSCFRQHVLRWQNTQITRIPVPRQLGLATYTLQLPAGLTCQNCVIQWLWRDDTSTCDPPRSNNCGQQTVTNCADVQILSAGVPLTANFDKPRYDAYASIFDPMDTGGDGADDHGIGIHVPRSSLDPAVTIKPPDPSPGGSVSIQIPGGVPPTTQLPGGSIPVITPGGRPSTNPSTDSSLPVITVIPDGASSANSTTGIDDDNPPETSEKLVGPIGVVLPAVVGTTNVLAGNTGLGIALLVLALYMYMSQQPLIQGNTVFGTPMPPTFSPSPLAYQSYLNPATSFQQAVAPSGSVYNSGVFPYTQTVSGGVFQGQSGFGGVSYPYLQNSNVAPGVLNSAIGPNVASGVFNSAIGPNVAPGVFQSANSPNVATGVFNTAIGTLPQTGFASPGIANTGFTSFQAPITIGGVSTGLSSGSPFIPQSLAGNGFVSARSNIPITNNGFSVTRQFPQGNNAFAQIPTQQSSAIGNTQIQETFQTQTSFQTPFQNRPDIVIPQFDQEPSTIRQRETKSNQEEDIEKEKSCECHSHMYILTAHCHVMSATECREDDACFCNEDKRPLPAKFHRGQRPLSSINTKPGQKMILPTQRRQLPRRLPSMRYNKQN